MEALIRVIWTTRGETRKRNNHNDDGGGALAD
jgi:hypothetical protein